MAMSWVGTKPGTFVNESTIVPISAGNLNALVNTIDAIVIGADNSGLNATTLQGFSKEGFATPADTNLIIYYSLDDCCDTLVLDDSASAEHATAFNISYIAGSTGKAAVLNGTSSYIQGTYSNVNEFTTSLWFKGTTATANNRLLTLFNTSTSFKVGVFISAGKAELRIRNSAGTVNTLTSSVSINNDEWNHICCTYDGITAKLYVNGKLQASLTTTFISSYYNSLRIGCSEESTPTTFTTGMVDEIRVYSRSLIENEVTGLYITKNGSKTLNPSTKTLAYSLALRKSNGSLEASTFDLPEDETPGFNLKLSNNSGLTSDRKLTINVSDADKTIGVPLSGDMVTVDGAQTLSNKTVATQSLGDNTTKIATTAFATQSASSNAIKYAIVLG